MILEAHDLFVDVESVMGISVKADTHTVVLENLLPKHIVTGCLLCRTQLHYHPKWIVSEK